MNKMKIVALLPMKAHSERVPNKNMRAFAGQPLYHRVVTMLESSSLVELIVIDTDSDTIAEDARSHFDKVKIVKRPAELGGDSVPMNNIIAHDIHLTEGDHFLQTHSTNPLLTRETMERAIQEYFSLLPEYDSVFSVTRMQSRLYWASGQPLNHNPRELLCTQKLPPVFVENSNIYLFSRQSFIAGGNNRIGLRPKMFIMNKLEGVDIDDEEDWKMAEALLKLRGNI